MIAYHDTEWGVPLHDERRLFEYVVLDTFQAGLSWRIVLNKRENFRAAMHDFDATKIARYGEKDIARLLADAGIIRNRLKIAGTVANAQAFLGVLDAEGEGGFARLCWSFVDGAPKVNRWTAMSQLPATSPESDAMAKELKRRGFRFAGSTVCYAFMQAAGLINDHVVTCPRHEAVQRVGAPATTKKVAAAKKPAKKPAAAAAAKKRAVVAAKKPAVAAAKKPAAKRPRSKT